MYNNRGPQDTRFAVTGKDGVIYDGNGKMLATVESYQVQVNVTNATYQPLGDAQEHSVLQSYKVTLTMSQVIVEDDDLINGSTQRMNYRGVVPDGNIDLQNVSIGDIIKRAWNMAVNDPPELQSMLALNAA